MGWQRRRVFYGREQFFEKGVERIESFDMSRPVKVVKYRKRRRPQDQ